MAAARRGSAEAGGGRPPRPGEAGAGSPREAAELRVLRLCSVFEPPESAVRGRGRSFDPIGGLQNHAAELTRALDRRGVAQTVVTTRPPAAPRRARLGDRSRVVRLGLPVRRFRQLYGLPASLVVPALAARAELVHVHVGEDLAALPIAAAAVALHRLPLVLTIHCSLCHTLEAVDARTRLLKALGGPIEAWGVRRASAVIVLTRRLADRLREDGVDPGRIHVIPSGVNPELFRGPFPDPFPDVSRPRIAFVGRLTAQKGVGTLVEAAALLRAPASVLLVGDGPERPRLEARLRELGLEGRVRICGFLPHARIPAVLAHADVLVLPSVYEELGSVLLEGMQAGLPIVATCAGGIPDAVTDGENGLLVEPGSPPALASALDRVLADELLAARLRRAARARAAAYDWNRLAERVLDVYRSVARPGRA